MFRLSVHQCQCEKKVSDNSQRNKETRNIERWQQNKWTIGDNIVETVRPIKNHRRTIYCRLWPENKKIDNQESQKHIDNRYEHQIEIHSIVVTIDPIWNANKCAIQWSFLENDLLQDGNRTQHDEEVEYVVDEWRIEETFDDYQRIDQQNRIGYWNIENRIGIDQIVVGEIVVHDIEDWRIVWVVLPK